MSYVSKHTGTTIDETVDLIQIVFDKIYPIGAIYLSVDNTNPSAIFGGTWEQIQDKFLMCAGSNYAAGSQGGVANHTHTTGDLALTTAQMPAHTHTRGTMNITGGCAPAHSSGVCWYNVTSASGAFYSYESVTNNGKPSLTGSFTGDHMLGFDASRSWTGETSSVGSSTAHNHGATGSSTNLPPYLAVYVWKRIA